MCLMVFRLVGICESRSHLWSESGTYSSYIWLRLSHDSIHWFSITCDHNRCCGNPNPGIPFYLYYLVFCFDPSYPSPTPLCFYLLACTYFLFTCLKIETTLARLLGRYPTPLYSSGVRVYKFYLNHSRLLKKSVYHGLCSWAGGGTRSPGG